MLRTYLQDRFTNSTFLNEPISNVVKTYKNKSHAYKDINFPYCA
jgi:hypothetical protein